MSVEVEFKGGTELQAALKALGDVDAARRLATRVLTNAANIVADEARTLAPDDPKTGLGKYLKEAIKVGSRKASSAASRDFRQNTLAGRRLVEVYVGIDGSVLPAQPPKTGRRRKRKAGGSSGGGVAAYSIFQEMGTSSMPAHPFMAPAWEAKQGEALSIIQSQLGDEITKTATRYARKAA